MAGLSAKMDISVMKARFDAAEPKVRAGVVSRLNRLGTLTASKLRAGAPRATSKLSTSFHPINGTVSNPTVEIVSDVKYWSWVDKGTKPHPVSEEGQAAIASWVVTKGLNLTDRTTGKEITPEAMAFLIARKIKKSGTKAQPFIDKAIDPAKAEAVALMKTLLAEVKI